jgi:hypothetical protein
MGLGDGIRGRDRNELAVHPIISDIRYTPILCLELSTLWYSLRTGGVEWSSGEEKAIQNHMTTRNPRRLRTLQPKAYPEAKSILVVSFVATPQRPTCLLSTTAALRISMLHSAFLVTPVSTYSPHASFILNVQALAALCQEKLKDCLKHFSSVEDTIEAISPSESAHSEEILDLHEELLERMSLVPAELPIYRTTFTTYLSPSLPSFSTRLLTRSGEILEKKEFRVLASYCCASAQ